MLPPGTKTAGIFTRAIAFRCAGTDLSQEEVSTMPSQGIKPACSSTISQIVSREARIRFMPSCPWAQPSQMSVAWKRPGHPPFS